MGLSLEEDVLKLLLQIPYEATKPGSLCIFIVRRASNLPSHALLSLSSPTTPLPLPFFSSWVYAYLLYT